MLKDKELLAIEIENKYKNIAESMGKRRQTLFLQKTCQNIKNRHNIQVSISMAAIIGTANRAGYSDFVLFAVLEELEPEKLKEYFTKREIEKYKKEIINEKKIKMPLTIPAIQVNADQWISVISFRTLMEWRDAQFIVYNTDTQRIMSKKISGEVEYYAISINKHAVLKIKESMLKGSYISDTLTFNIPPDKGEIFYNEDSGLTINAEEGIDIIDGYHRFLAISQIFDNNSQLEGNLEIRITNFPESKAKQFIWQQDQKTQMKKELSDSFNQYNNGNIVAQRLNEDPMCDFQGNINSVKGILYAPSFSFVVNKLWFTGKEDKSYLYQVVRELRTKLNIIYESNVSMFSEQVTNKILVLILYSCRYSDDPAATFAFTTEKMSDREDKLFSIPLKIKTQNLIKDCLKEGGINV